MDDREAHSYIYQPLLSPDHVRLVDLLPGDRQMPLHVELHNYPINETPPFDALELMSDSTTPKCDIVFCNGLTLLVSRDVYLTLQSLRHVQHSRLLFVGQISHSTEDPDEYKSISHVTDAFIYRAAARTLCCTKFRDLPLLRASIDRAARLSYYEQAASQCFRPNDVFRSDLKVTYKHLQEFEDLVGQVHPSSTKTCLEEFIEQSYFSQYVHHCSPYAVEKFLMANHSGHPWIANIAISKEPLIVVTNNEETGNLDQEVFPWEDIANALLAWHLFDPMGMIQSASLHHILNVQSIRRVIQDKPLVTFSDIWLRLQVHNSDTQFERTAEARWILMALNQLPIASPDKLETVEASMLLNMEAKQPLSLSLASGFSDERSWAFDLQDNRTKLLLNHPASDFVASMGSPNEIASFNIADSYGSVIEAPWDWSCRGYVVDVIRRTSEQAMPPRRRCDHYIVGHNAYFFTEWYEFAHRNSRKKSFDDALLAFTDTIQARGCGVVWEDRELSEKDRVEQLEHFLKFLENPDAVLTNKIRIFYASCFASHERRFAVTKKGHFCLVPVSTRDGDLVCVPNGSRVPYIFRHMRGKKIYRNVGEAYVNGTMHGEGSVIDPQEEQEFVLL